MTPPAIRRNAAPDRGALENLYRAAFPAEDLVPLVNALLDLPAGVISLEAEASGRLAGHILFSLCTVEGSGNRLALLGPLAVSPDVQRSGIGSALIREGLAACRVEGVIRVQVLGDPAYYGRFGFAEDGSVKPPFAIPDEWKPAWQTIALTEGADRIAGTLTPPLPWMQPALWQP